MSINSMTGFATKSFQIEDYSIQFDIKSVNHRFKDIRVKLPSYLGAFESALKKKVDSAFFRGSFDIYINFKKDTVSEQAANFDEAKLKKYIDTLKSFSEREKVSFNFDSLLPLRSEFQLEENESVQSVMDQLLNQIDPILDDLKERRKEEGGKLLSVLQGYLGEYMSLLAEVKKEKGSYQDMLREKFQKKFKDEFEGGIINEERFNQEIIYYLEKLDIDEEIDRINSHYSKFSSLLSLREKKAVGREMDFLIQELGRETNTIGAKSGSSMISNHVVQMKVFLEKLKEQVSNIE